jgi:hypothetical protein
VSPIQARASPQWQQIADAIKTGLTNADTERRKKSG